MAPIIGRADAKRAAAPKFGVTSIRRHKYVSAAFPAAGQTIPRVRSSSGGAPEGRPTGGFFCSAARRPTGTVGVRDV